MAFLLARNGPAAGKNYELAEGSEWVLGRHVDCEIVIDVGAVSRQHAKIALQGPQFTLQDLNSRNRTFLNGADIFGLGPRPLHDGDELRICDVVFTFHTQPAPRDWSAKTEPIDQVWVQSLVDLLRDQHVNFRGPNWLRLQGELNYPQSPLCTRLRETFQRIVLLDGDDGVTLPGRFDMDRFLLAAWNRIASSFALPFDETTFHPEQIAQALKSESPALFCLLNVQRLSEEDLHCLRGLGFTQENHHVLYVGNNPNLGTIAIPAPGEAPWRTNTAEFGVDQDTLAIDTSSSIMGIDTSSSVPSAKLLTAAPEVKLSALLEITRELARSLAVGDVLPKVFDSLFRIFVQADRGILVMRDDDGKLTPLATRVRRENSDDTIRVSRTIVNQVMNSREAILSADAATDSRFDLSQSIADFRIRSMMCAPLLDNEGTAIGALQVDTLDQRKRFQREDLEVLASVAAQVGFAINNAKMHEALLKQHVRERDLQLAANIQRGFLPKQVPALAGYELSHAYESADFVGGDLYDYVKLDEHRLVLVIGDVAGRGFAAALMMARLCASIRAHLFSQPSLPLAMAAINREAVEAADEQRFVTLQLAELNAATHKLTLVNAGHLAPLLKRANGLVESIGQESAGLPAGIVMDAEYTPVLFSLEAGDQLLLFTDGVSEVVSQSGTLFGLERLRRLLAESSGDCPDTVARIVSEAHSFAGGKLQDDLCLVACRRVS